MITGADGRCDPVVRRSPAAFDGPFEPASTLARQVGVPYILKTALNKADAVDDELLEQIEMWRSASCWLLRNFDERGWLGAQGARG